MTTAVAPARRLPRPLQVARIQTLNVPVQMIMPWGVLALSFVVNLVIFALVPNDGSPKITGAIITIYIFTLVTHLVTMTQIFPFALGLSVTRRDFFLGNAGFIVVQSAVQGLLMTLFLAVEEATNGWGQQMHFFSVPFLVTGNWFTQWLVYTVPFLLFSFLSVVGGTVFKRFGQIGMWTVGLLGLVLGGLAAILITWQNAWPAVGRFFADTSPLALFAGYPAILAAVAAAVGYLLLRRAMP
ncbi:hypothetical protein GCM10009836_20050 [Pseudonocardia ailaonensis]|uniref:ABC transporter permease n=1 Tax=Pseudonocardia ailaonensis TaxID=367279 RepID=A0ABN2MWA2_9PSEU